MKIVKIFVLKALETPGWFDHICIYFRHNLNTVYHTSLGNR
jgi:hypothetical protein